MFSRHFSDPTKKAKWSEMVRISRIQPAPVMGSNFNQNDSLTLVDFWYASQNCMKNMLKVIINSISLVQYRYKTAKNSFASYLIIRLHHWSPNPFGNATEQFGLSRHALYTFLLPSGPWQMSVERQSNLIHVLNCRCLCVWFCLIFPFDILLVPCMRQISREAVKTLSHFQLCISLLE